MLQGFLGMLVLGLLSNALNMAGVSSFLQTLVVGIVILLAVIVDRLRTKKG
jgi:ribose transport system permease protein